MEVTQAPDDGLVTMVLDAEARILRSQLVQHFGEPLFLAALADTAAFGAANARGQRQYTTSAFVREALDKGLNSSKPASLKATNHAISTCTRRCI